MPSLMADVKHIDLPWYFQHPLELTVDDMAVRERPDDGSLQYWSCARCVWAPLSDRAYDRLKERGSINLIDVSWEDTWCEPETLES